MGLVKSGRGSASAGMKVEREVLGRLGLAMDGVDAWDGSGLSRRGSVSARNFALLLIAMNAHRASKAYRDALPVGGVDGTLRGRYGNSPAKGKVFAKTGSMYAVSALSGYVVAKSGKQYVFSILLNKFGSASGAARAIQDKIVERIYEDQVNQGD